jgi:outer membrane lipoprotein-sorting protein
MKAVLNGLVLAALVLASGRSASAQTADEIVEKHLTAMGGRAALGKLTSRSTAGTMTLSTPMGEISGSIETLNQRPNKTRTLINLDLTSLGAGPMTVDQRFDGTTGYALDSMRGNHDITGGQLDAMKNGEFPNPLLSYKERGVTVELSGKEKVGERDAYVLLFKPKSGASSRQFIDAESYLLIKLVQKLDIPELGEVEQTTQFSDFRDVDGVKLPFTVKATSAVQSFTVTRRWSTTRRSTSRFSRPVEK